MSKKVLVTGDIHSGSKVAPIPGCMYNIDYDVESLGTNPQIKMDFEEVRNIKPNKVSKHLFKKYEELCDAVGTVDVHINLGDTCDGFNRKAHGKGTYTTDLMTQVSTSVYLEMMIKARKREVLQGSYYHVGDNLSTDELFAKFVGAGHHDDLKLTVEKTVCYFRHPIGATRSVWMYKPTKVAQQMLLGEINKAEYGKFNIYGFGHTHSFVGVEYGSSYGFTCPGWKGRDGYAKRGTLGWLPQHGHLLFEIDGKDYEKKVDVFTMNGKHVIDEVKI